VEQLKVK